MNWRTPIEPAPSAWLSATRRSLSLNGEERRHLRLLRQLDVRLHEPRDPGRIAASGFFRPEIVSKMVDEHVRRRADHSRALWSLIVFEHWNQQHAVAPRPVELEPVVETSEVAAQA